ncbi:hypothetical protein MARPO_0030s0126 [Marchantia polymorpha]|uniref:Uncharacterized protein n=1 Tax=Marchantia polymorpha TaxID=3197 RepID=A0A2R6X8H8_MARPO|nr:hypothetical protein MARPO_0030s0126 [Marchantia polymorpha]|eukprot:PTQ42403.1 hypothetical protein MARPO_0030s0126 [Marchantia polymorpha]
MGSGWVRFLVVRSGRHQVRSASARVRFRQVRSGRGCRVSWGLVDLLVLLVRDRDLGARAEGRVEFGSGGGREGGQERTDDRGEKASAFCLVRSFASTSFALRFIIHHAGTCLTFAGSASKGHGLPEGDAAASIEPRRIRAFFVVVRRKQESERRFSIDRAATFRVALGRRHGKRLERLIAGRGAFFTKR